MKRLFLLLGLTILCSTAVAQQKYHDAAMFNAPKGNVKYIEYEDGRIFFAEDGSLVKEESSYLSQYSAYNIKRDNDGYPIEVTTDSDKTLIEYTEDKRVRKRTIIIGGEKLIYAYDYKEFPKVTMTRFEFIDDIPKTKETIYDMNEFDAQGNWVKKGIEGIKREKQVTHVENANLLVTDPVVRQIVWTSTERYYEGREEQNRIVSYRYNKEFKRSDSPNEINIFYSVVHPFFFNAGWSSKGIKKHIKANKIEHELKENVGWKEIEILIPESDKVFFGYPIGNMQYRCDKSGDDYYPDYRFIIYIDSIAERDGFFEYIVEDAKKHETLKEQTNDMIRLNSSYYTVYLVKIPYGIEVRRREDVPYEWK